MAGEAKDRGGLAAVILAAGASRRMGEPKSLLRLDGETFLERWLRVLREAGVKPIRAVLAPGMERLQKELALDPSWVVVNPDPGRGMLSSFQEGLNSLPSGVAGAFLCPVDHPRITPALLRRMASALRPGGIVLPVHQGRRGHPALFAAEVFPELLAAPLAEGARHVVHARPERVVEVAADAGVLLDVNTPGDYRGLAGS